MVLDENKVFVKFVTSYNDTMREEIVKSCNMEKEKQNMRNTSKEANKKEELKRKE